MLSMVLALALGFFLGFSGLAGRYAEWAGPASSAGVALLLFLLGAKMGSDAEIMAGLSILGLEALAYAVAAVVGSLVAVKLLESALFSASGRQKRGGSS